jgi:hypothetical protein
MAEGAGEADVEGATDGAGVVSGAVGVDGLWQPAITSSADSKPSRPVVRNLCFFKIHILVNPSFSLLSAIKQSLPCYQLTSVLWINKTGAQRQRGDKEKYKK